MRIKNLKLKNIGPFKESNLDFISSDDESMPPPVIIITGENGTGKSIILDAIRTLFLSTFGHIEREIDSDKNFLIESNILIDSTDIKLITDKKSERNSFVTNSLEISQLFHSQFKPSFKKDFVFDYWTSKLSNDSFTINQIEALKANSYLDNILKGVQHNIDLTKTIAFFDYLRDSKNESERNLGESLYSLLEKVINISISNGELSHVSRINLKPIIKIQNIEVALDKLSSGNLYLIQRLTSLLRQVYSICVLNNIPISEYKSIKGVLLIDEAENHLHPKWQKVFLKNILELFPNLQIIVTTHSPFIVSSVENTRVYVCKSKIDHSIIEEESDLYSNQPIEDILMSPLFNTSNFNVEISELLQTRKEALAENNQAQVEEIEKKLLEKNPQYFNYLNIEKLISSLKK